MFLNTNEPLLLASSAFCRMEKKVVRKKSQQYLSTV
jgi:hypothetical protein